MLTESQRAFLAEPRFATLATLMPDGRPHVCVMWYELRDDAIILTTAASRAPVKDRNIRRDQRVAVCVEDGGSYVAVQGTATLIEDQAIAKADTVRMIRRYEPGITDERIREEYAIFLEEERETIRISIEKAYGTE